MNVHANDLIAVPDALETATAGTMVWWRIESECVDCDDFRVRCEARRIPKPRAVSAKAVLKRACTKVVKAQEGLFLRPVRDGWAFVQEDAEVENFEKRLEAYVLSKKEFTVHFRGDYDASLCPKIREMFYEESDTMTIQEISSWLTTKVVPWLDAVALREGGGVYFVPRSFSHQLRALATFLLEPYVHDTPHLPRVKLYQVPALQTSNALEAITDAIIHETEQQASYALYNVDSVKSQEGYDARQGKLKAAYGKLERYEGLLGARLTKMRELLEDRERTLTVHALKLLAGES